MKKSNRIFWPAIALILNAGLALAYVFYVRDLVQAAYIGQAPDWFMGLIANFYPRFIVEQKRFDLAFFLNKADQVLIRFTIVNIASILFFLGSTYLPKLKQQVHTYWNGQSSVRAIHWFCSIFFLILLCYGHEFIDFLLIRAKMRTFYKPVQIFSLLHIPFPSIPAIYGLYGSMIGSTVLALFGFRRLFTGTLAIGLFILLQGFLYSFEKTEHIFATLDYAALLMPFLIWENEQARRNGFASQADWPLKLMRLCVALVYMMAGAEKFLTGGLAWLSPVTFRSYLQLHDSALGQAVAAVDWLCTLLPLCAMLFQLGFILVLWLPRYRYYFLLGGVLFHFSTFWLLNVGGYFTPWIAVYILFVDFEKLMALPLMRRLPTRLSLSHRKPVG